MQEAKGRLGGNQRRGSQRGERERERIQKIRRRGNENRELNVRMSKQTRVER